MKKIISILMLIYLINPMTIYAQLPPAIIINPRPVIPAAPPAPVQSNSVVTQFGNAPQDQKPSIGSTGLFTAASNLVAAYNAKSGGLTDSVYPVGELTDFLATYYPTNILTSFIARRSNAMPNGCVECLGFVGLSLTLVTGSTDTFMGNSPVGTYYNLGGFKTGGVEFKKISADEIKSGDVGVTQADALDSSIGHILIVKTASPASPDTFVGLESSYPTRCKVNDQKSHVRKDYNFFREQS